MSDNERDELAKAVHSGFFGLLDGGFDDEDLAIADAVQKSHWLVSRDRRMKAEALEEAASIADKVAEEAHRNSLSADDDPSSVADEIAQQARARAAELREETN